MKQKKKKQLHSRNRHQGRYDFEILVKAYPELKNFIFTNKYDVETVDFSDENAVRALNTALLKGYYDIQNWFIPRNYLCPPIPGRADYIHYIADLLADGNEGDIPQGRSVKVLDIGVGANVVYPIIGTKEYNWRFVGSEIDPVAFRSAKNTIEANPKLTNSVECRFQKQSEFMFKGVIRREELFDVVICNPPFHASLKDAEEGTKRKWRNLGIKKDDKTSRNFGGKSTELWYPGGELAFIRNMVRQSSWIPTACFWYTTLVSKQENLGNILRAVKRARATEVRKIDMGQGQKSSRVVAWTFLTREQQAEWRKERWTKKEKKEKM